MSGRPSDEKLQSLREMLLIAPFHRWLGLDIVALNGAIDRSSVGVCIRLKRW